MSERWTKLTLELLTEGSYNMISLLIKRLFDSEKHWPVEAYNKEELSIEFKEVTADVRDAIGFAEVLSEQLFKIAARAGDKREAIERISFKLNGITRYLNSGEENQYIIEKANKNITIRETGNYMIIEESTFPDYDSFCEEIEEYCPNVTELLSEEDYDPEVEYAITSSGVYADDIPDYGDPCPIEKY